MARKRRRRGEIFGNYGRCGAFCAESEGEFPGCGRFSFVECVALFASSVKKCWVSLENMSAPSCADTDYLANDGKCYPKPAPAAPAAPAAEEDVEVVEVEGEFVNNAPVAVGGRRRKQRKGRKTATRKQRKVATRKQQRKQQRKSRKQQRKSRKQQRKQQ